MWGGGGLVGIGFTIGVGSGDGQAGFVEGVGWMGGTGFRLLLVWDASGRYKVGGRGLFTPIPVLAGVLRDGVSFLGVWWGVGDASGCNLGDAVVSSRGEVGGM